MEGHGYCMDEFIKLLNKDYELVQYRIKRQGGYFQYTVQ